MNPTQVVFDIGGVLVDWHPHLAWMDALGSRAAVDAFMTRTDFMARNSRADAGASFADLAQEILDEADRHHFETYVSLFTRTVPNALQGTWDLLDQLKAKGVPLHAITNWSAETWPEGVKVHPRLDSVFETLVVSGRENLAKPDVRIFELLCQRAGNSPSDCVFIDDGLHNVEGARAAGMDGIHFTTPKALETELKQRGLL
ncbi:MAG: HAD family phosphatase [Roseobacter sp.]